MMGHENVIFEGASIDLKTPLLAAFLLSLLAMTISAQLPVAIDYQEPQIDARCGSAIADVGDIDGDGVADLLVGVPGNATSSGPKARARLLSGFDGSQIYSVSQFKMKDSFGAAVAATGDLDGDGVPDFAVGAPTAENDQRGAIYAYSGATGSLIFSFLGSATDDRMGTSVVSIGDVNGDGVSDILAGAPRAHHLVSYGGRARVLSGTNGAVLRVHDGTVVYETLGLFVSAMDDLDGDGIRDYAIAAPGAPVPLGVGVGVVRVYSGASGAVLYEASDPTSTQFVTALARIGDLDGDGLDDLLIANSRDLGAPQLGGYRGLIRVVSGVNGALLFQIRGLLRDEYLGQGIASIADLDGDGLDEILATSRWSSGIGLVTEGGVRVFSGANGELLREFDVPDCLAVCAVSDLNGDGLDDIAVGRPELYTLSESGRATVFFSQPLTTLGLGSGQANNLVSTLLVNGANTYGNPGPFIDLVPAGGLLVLDLVGHPMALFDLLVSPTLSPGAAIFPGFGSLDIGTPPLFTDVMAVVQGLSAGQVQYATNFASAARVTMMIPAGWPPGLLGCVQGLVQIPQPPVGGAWARLTAAHQIIVQ